ncbi:MAG: HAD family hydrolase, partial [Nodosilinea sp.]
MAGGFGLSLGLPKVAPAVSQGFADPLPSWRPGSLKQAIVNFVQRACTLGSPHYIPPVDRIATFDNDGTLWSEQPAYFQAMFVFDRIRQMAPDHPEWKEQLPYSAVLKGDMKTALEGGESALFKMVMATHSGMTTEEFETIVRQWIETARHPKTGKLYTEMVFQPMLELLALLKANDFRVYIVSGGGVDFMRVFSERVYGIPPEQVIGSRVRT